VRRSDRIDAKAACAALALAIALVATGSASGVPKQRDAESPVDPQSAAFLDAIRAPSRPVPAASGSKLKLWSCLEYAELPDWDPSRELHRIKTHWEQKAGSKARISDPDGTRAEAAFPEVTVASTLEFQVTMTNRSGSAVRTVIVQLRPRP
jgi:hypothetical protein